MALEAWQLITNSCMRACTCICMQLLMHACEAKRTRAKHGSTDQSVVLAAVAGLLELYEYFDNASALQYSFR